jgi:hypothetical protein
LDVHGHSARVDDTTSTATRYATATLASIPTGRTHPGPATSHDDCNGKNT